MSVISRPARHPQFPVSFDQSSFVYFHHAFLKPFDAARFVRFGGAPTQKPQERGKYVNSDKVIFSGSASVLAHGPSLKNFGGWFEIAPEKIALHDARWANFAIRGAGSAQWRKRRHPNVTLLRLHSFAAALEAGQNRTNDLRARLAGGRLGVTSESDRSRPWKGQPIPQELYNDRSSD